MRRDLGGLLHTTAVIFVHAWMEFHKRFNIVPKMAL